MEDLRVRARSVLEKLQLDEKRKQIREIEADSMKADFWKDNMSASSKMKEMGRLQKELEQGEYLELLISENNEAELKSLLETLEVYLYLGRSYDKNNAIVTIQAGQGGADAMDWAMMLYRMYCRFFEKKGWKTEVLDEAAGEEAGIKNVHISVEGEFAYGYLRGERGVHRLVRLSPFNADKLRHTSFALVDIFPQLDEVEGFIIKEDELQWDFYRASSHGGQNVQKVSSAVRLTHVPTGIVVTCQKERHQAQNREVALKLLKAKLWAKHEEEKRQEAKQIKGEYIAPSWGNQIRSYVLHPYQMVKDLRTGVETSNTEGVLNGELGEFIEAELKLT